MKNILFLNAEQMSVVMNNGLGIESLNEDNLKRLYTANFVWSLIHGDNSGVADNIVKQCGLKGYTCGHDDTIGLNMEHVSIPHINAALLEDHTLLVWELDEQADVGMRNTNYMLQHNYRRILMALGRIMSVKDLTKTNLFAKCINAV